MLLSTSAAAQSAGPLSIRTWPSAMVASNILASLAVSASATNTLLPYIPTTILVPGSITDSNDSSAYIFTPDRAGDSVDLVSVGFSSALASSSASDTAKTVTSGLPFLSSSSNTTTFSPTLASDGSIIVYAGDCTSDSGLSIWIYNTTSSGSASWKQQQASSDGAAGPGFLGGGLAFSQVLSPFPSASHIYSYGGQCPNSTLNGTTWINGADYSHAMVKLKPSADGYKAETLSLGFPPVAEAGFSFTQLLPSTSNVSGTVTQSANSVVLGGHTQGAFVNMSTAAIWTLPEESWSYIAISGPSGSASSDSGELAKNGDLNTQVQSRSGHTAVLNEAGTALVILGGWVGSTSQAAEPQLAVLQLDEGVFGEWTWSVPDDQPLANGEGLYGHGAALLPGNVMMVAGGYSISSSSGASAARLGRRDAISVAGGQVKMFLNLTSLAWSDSYTNPLTTSSSDKNQHINNTKLGLGVGLGVGIPLVAAMLGVAFCASRRQRHRHTNRDGHIGGLFSGAAFITSEEMLGTEHEHHHHPWATPGAARWYSYTGGHDPYLRDEKSLGYESLRGTGGVRHPDFGSSETVEPPRGYRGAVRRQTVPRVAKGLYQPTGVDESRALAVISPILEDEEDETAMHGAISPDRDMEGEDDPFVTPLNSTPTPTASRFPGGNERSTIFLVAPSPSPGPPSPSHGPTRMQAPRIQLQHSEVTDWVSDVDASDALITRRIQPHSTSMRSRGRTSPVRRQSVRISAEGERVPVTPGGRTASDLSESNRSAFSFNRSDSTRTAAAIGGMLTTSNTENRGGTSHSDNSNSNSSYTAAKSIPTLQSEGPSLLLGRPRAISVIQDVADVSDDEPGSPSKNKAPRRSWFGSLRRVFSGPSSGSSATGSSRTESPTHGESGDYDRFGLGSLGLGAVGLLQNRRQGPSAWDDGGVGTSTARHGYGAGEGWEEDWDIERAVEQRLVQVMFSVPKERLRIVNGEPDIISIEESVVVVDPEKDGQGENDEEEDDELSHIVEDKGFGKAEGKQPGADTDTPKASDSGEQSRDAPSEKKDKGKQPEERRSLLLQHKNSSFESASNERSKEAERRSRLLEVPPSWDSDGSESPRRSFSPGVPMQAEEVRYERPRTRVLDMVENFEQQSRSNSPSKERFA